ncbi:MAG: guanylate kinase [Sandaracinus sp.]
MDDLILLILSSPSGAGKTTLTKYLLEQLPDYTFSVSHTTRKPRAGETNGEHYHFVDRATFELVRASGGFAEWAEVHGNLYGTSLAELERARAQGKRGIVFDIDYQGARQIKATRPEAIGVFVLPPSLEILRKRLEGRATDSPEVIERRFKHAQVEIEHYGFFDYVIVNDELEKSKRALLGIALAERHRRVRMAPLAEALLRTGRI